MSVFEPDYVPPKSSAGQFASYLDTMHGYLTYPKNLGPQTLIGNDLTILMEITGFVRADDWDDLRLTREHQAPQFSQLLDKLKKGKTVKLWTFDTTQPPKSPLNIAFPIYQHPTLGPLCDMDILTPVSGGVVIMRQPAANDQLGLSHDLMFYGVLIDL